MTRSITVLLCLAAFGCGPKILYDGPQRPVGEVARVFRPLAHEVVQVAVLTCDDRGAGGTVTPYLEFLPGPHACRVTCTFGDRKTDVFVINLRVEAGRAYRLEGQAAGSSCAVEATDLGPIEA